MATSGLLPTPTGTDYKSRGPNSKQVGIDNFLKLLPTPQAVDSGKERPLRMKKDMPRNPNTIGSWRGDLKDHIAFNAISSRADFLASLLAKPDEDEARMMTATSGRKCLELYNLQSRHGSLLKTCVDYLLSNKAWYSSKCALTWKPVVTKSNRLLFQLYPSTPRTAEIGSGLLPTVKTNEWKGTSGKNRHEPSLHDKVTMLPTPDTSARRSQKS